ncbi:rhodanese-related sulfurtransferase [Scopulibacillus darangshiensis]|uniref:Rhodanese-related sulfurtransferase n=1 Tax=Scopulibacillus darangshiensis TaxID=442528 RepID=A0A4R2NYD9_9BACL|nr:rhodanese-like domain-containing protein [Scopulibacillus darangshiensis]TCP26644.1 rhodanese-related sulfurtransferase [Scopulibacillus darangshiensis]
MCEMIEIIRPEQLNDRLKGNEDICVVDVRENEEVIIGKIPNAKHIRLSEIPDRLDELDASKEHILVCRSGRRSEKAAEFLQEKGFTVKNMVGGMLKWQGEVE